MGGASGGRIARGGFSLGTAGLRWARSWEQGRGEEPSAWALQSPDVLQAIVQVQAQVSPTERRSEASKGQKQPWS